MKGSEGPDSGIGSPSPGFNSGSSGLYKLNGRGGVGLGVDYTGRVWIYGGRPYSSLSNDLW
jgi:hypothetical protein